METIESRKSAFRRGFLTTCSYLKAPLGGKRLPPLPYDTPERRDSGLILVLPGIEGKSIVNYSLSHGLSDAGLPYAIHLHDWTLRCQPAMINLWLTSRTKRAAAGICEKIVEYQDQYPDRPVHLVGHSGGAALIPRVLEELPSNRKIENAVMIAPALSPKYDLSHALSRVHGKIFHVCSRLDLYFLGFGTTLVGTLDRRFGFSAGNVGFHPPEPSDTGRAQIYKDRLFQLRYRFGMLRDWHYGGHLSCLNRVFVERHISPFLQRGLQPSLIPSSPGMPLMPLQEPPIETSLGNA